MRRGWYRTSAMSFGDSVCLQAVMDHPGQDQDSLAGVSGYAVATTRTYCARLRFFGCLCRSGSRWWITERGKIAMALWHSRALRQALARSRAHQIKQRKIARGE